MPSYRVLIKASAEKEMDALPRGINERIAARILTLAANPRPPGSRKLQGQNGYRLRVGAYRLLYSVDDLSAAIMVYSVGHRREVYR